MAKLTLEIEEDYDFQLIGISSHVKDYRICWEINRNLNFDLVREESLKLKTKEGDQNYAFFVYEDEENLIEYYLISNRSEFGRLIPEEPKSDYFLLTKGHITEAESQEICKSISQLKPVLTSYLIEVEALKSKENLIF